MKKKLISTSMAMVLLLYNSFTWQYMTGDGAGAKIRDKGGAGAEAENK